MRSTLSKAGISLLCFLALLCGEAELHLFEFVKGGKIGFIDSLGTEVIPAQFGSAGYSTRFQEGLANVAVPSGWGYIDVTGKFVIPPVYGAAIPFSEGMGAVQLPGQGQGWGFVDSKGKLLIQNLKTPSSFHEGLAVEQINGKWGYLSRDMRMVIQPRFDYAHQFQEGRAQIENGDKWGYIDRTGKIVVPAKYDITMPFTDGLGRVKVFRRTEPYPKGLIGIEGQTSSEIFYWGCVNLAGSEAIPPQFLDLTAFADGYAFARPDGQSQMGIIDRNGNFVVPPRFDQASSFSESVAAVRVGKQWGYVNSAAKWVIPASFQSAEAFSNGLARVLAKPGVYGYINHTGDWVWRVDRVP
jgi:hypothetical protein